MAEDVDTTQRVIRTAAIVAGKRKEARQGNAKDRPIGVGRPFQNASD
jgi:hypothetical protein